MSPEDSVIPSTADGTPGRDEVVLHGLSFGAVADLYDRARPGYPEDAVDWLGEAPRNVLELGAGTGKLTALLVAAGHRVVATDPSPEMLAIAAANAPGARTVVATSERIPLPSRTVDIVVAAQSFHWFNHPVALDEIARVLRPGGQLVLVWNHRDEGIPWVRKLGRILGNESPADLVEPLRTSTLFGDVEETEFRFWQNLRKDELLDLVRSRSYVLVMPEHERADVLARVGALYDDYGRGHDGMQLPYLTRCYRAVVTDEPPERIYRTAQDDGLDLVLGAETAADDGDEPATPAAAPDPDATQPVPRPDVDGPPPERPGPPEDPGTLLIDFR